MLTQNIDTLTNRGLGVPQFTRDITAPLIDVVLHWLPPVAKVRGWLQVVAFESALNRAYGRFKERYPEYAASFFANQFPKQNTAALLNTYLQNQRLPQASELALTWEEQLGPATLASRNRRLAEMTPAAADFLGWLEMELRGQGVFGS
jgi:hypothetical protein